MTMMTMILCGSLMSCGLSVVERQPEQEAGGTGGQTQTHLGHGYAAAASCHEHSQQEQ